MASPYVVREWLNGDTSPSTGSVVAYDGPSNWDDERSTFFEVADCHVKARLHLSKHDTPSAFAAKMRKLADVALKFADHLEESTR